MVFFRRLWPRCRNLFQANYDGFFLEYDSDRSGDFAPLAHAENRIVVLGLLIKIPELEDENAVIAHIHEAEKYLP